MNEKWMKLYAEIGDLKHKTAVISDLLIHHLSNETGISEDLLVQQMRSRYDHKYNSKYPETLSKLKDPQNSAVIASLLQENRERLQTILHFQIRLYAQAAGIPVQQAESQADALFQQYSSQNE